MFLSKIGYLFFCLFISLELLGDKPNVLLIVCDDLNDYVETLGGHPQTRTPNIRKLIDSGVSFTQAHCNILSAILPGQVLPPEFIHIHQSSSALRIGIKMKF